MSDREVMKQLFSELVKNSSVKRKGLAQISLLKQEKEAKLKGKEKEFYTALPMRFTKYFRESEKINKSKKEPQEKPIKQKTQIQIQATPVQKQSSITYETGEFPVVRKDTKAQGDCFFSSLFRAAKEQELLDTFEACLEIPINSVAQDKSLASGTIATIIPEELFIQGLRDILAEKVAEDEDGKISGMYEYLTETSETNTNSFQQVFNEMPDWFREEFEYGLPDDVEEFIQIMSINAGTSGNYVAELEVGIMKKIIEECGIHVELHVTPIQKAKKETEEGVPILHIINLGPPDYEEGHYEYYSFFPLAKKGGKRTLACGKRKSRKSKK